MTEGTKPRLFLTDSRSRGAKSGRSIRVTLTELPLATFLCPRCPGGAHRDPHQLTWLKKRRSLRWMRTQLELSLVFRRQEGMFALSPLLHLGRKLTSQETSSFYKELNGLRHQSSSSFAQDVLAWEGELLNHSVNPKRWNLMETLLIWKPWRSLSALVITFRTNV